MVSTWWLLIAFVVGGSAGVIALALMQMAEDSPDIAPDMPDLNAMPNPPTGLT
jgi:hypothetical protein